MNPRAPHAKSTSTFPRPAMDPTDLYDTLSEALRERPRHAGEAHGALRRADRALTALDRHLRDGGVLPEPWRGKRD